MRIETDLDGKTVDAIERHYLHAKEKHPYFCDFVQPQCLTDNVKMYIKNSLSDMRNLIKKEVDCKHLGWEAILNCEIWEIIDSLAEYDDTQAIEECYDAIAVLLRVVDVLEGNQPLGNPDECGQGFKMYLEVGLEGVGDGANHKPVPFAIQCPFCKGFDCHDVAFQRFPVKPPKSPKGLPFFANVRDEDCGKPMNMEYAKPEYKKVKKEGV